MEEAAAWFDKESPALGDSFREELDATLQRVLDNPEAYARSRREIRIARLRRFPYIVAFYYETERVFVIAVVHEKRQSSHWNRRS
jgi:plasmid stabilization system protein ParE